MIKISLEPKAIRDEFPSLIEKCVFCSTPTRYWNKETNMPVCDECAKKKSIDDLKAKLIHDQIN